MLTISGSVGRGGANARDDVLLVQLLLNANIGLSPPVAGRIARPPGTEAAQVGSGFQAFRARSHEPSGCLR